MKAALLVQPPGEIPVVEGDDRLDAGGEKIVDQAGVVVEAGLVDGADAVGQDARPGDREAVGVDAEILEERDVLEVLLAVVGVDGDVAGLVLAVCGTVMCQSLV